jgi:hypothetical protein
MTKEEGSMEDLHEIVNNDHVWSTTTTTPHANA